ncbi:NADH dehydrogenase [Pirellulimonas nuda]|uniref:NADH dehydrogenase n=1 Tax=Pirellulimonas nuda TaxID=2528009 RepID=A0A518D9T3_9BACT|nr:FAD-dependent oxidoreductase [Pirellulimonas nuda]QDU88255.1 NADH dehydrogenase [Pirellulimonas nuda]
MNKRCIALLGMGHTNLEIARRWIDSPLPDCRLVCISKFGFSTYSGMLPGRLAGQFDAGEMEVRLAPLARRAGAELVLDEVVGLGPEQRTLCFAHRQPLAFDALSIGVGSMPAGWDDFDAPSLVPIKPMQTFVERLEERIGCCGATPRCVIVGGGVAGVEVALCLDARLRGRGPAAPRLAIVTASDQIAEGLSEASRRTLRKVLAGRSIKVVTGLRVAGVDPSGVRDQHGRAEPADVIIWATGAAPPPILSRLGLPTDERGFLATGPTLQSTGGAPIFAVGDAGTVLSDPAPKAGVFAVRQADTLWKNLRAIAAGEAPRAEFDPQAAFLKILNTGQGRALLDYRGFCFHARWCWLLKCWIDRRFIRRYQ